MGVRLEQRVAIVTGAGRNIGEGIAGALADEGARVAVVDVHEGRARAAAQLINARHAGAAMPLVVDVSSGAAVERMVAEVVARWGGVDLLVNNAAVTDRKTVLELSEEEWDRVLQVTLKGVFLCSKAVAAWMIAQGRRGVIVNIASGSGYRGRASSTAYSAAKGGVINLTRSLAVQLSPHGIRVNSVVPGNMNVPTLDPQAVLTDAPLRPTDRDRENPLGRRGQPGDIGAAVVYLASDEASFVAGAELAVDGGASAG